MDKAESEFLRVQTRNEWRSICKKCYRTAATASTEDGLSNGEAEHKCPGSFKLD